jgi:pimeloyl-ACP methyl ester carboxylesterase
MSDCGYVTVPERHRQPNGRTIELAVVRTRSPSPTPAPDPIVVEQGGPGGSTIDIYPAKGLIVIPSLPAILQQRDMVFVEQRGTQFSKPYLPCPEESTHKIAVARGERRPDDTTWVKACRDRMLAEGVNPSAFNSVENAADIYTVVETLGYRQFNYYGASYGTLLGQYVMAQANEHRVKLRSVILDGVMRSDVDFNLATPYSISQALRNLFADCARDPQCNQAYPDLERVLLELLDRLNQTPVPATLTVASTQEQVPTAIDGTDLVYALMPYLYQTAKSPELPRDLYRAFQHNDFSWAEANLSDDLETKDATGMYLTVLCARVPSVRVEPMGLFPKPYPQLMAVGQQESDRVTRACELLQVEPEALFANNNTEIPTLIFNGAYDPVTPQAYGEAVASNLKNSHVYTFPGVGHGTLIALPGTPAETCSASITLDFLANPQRPPNSDCLAKTKPTFVTTPDPK